MRNLLSAIFIIIGITCVASNAFEDSNYESIKDDATKDTWCGDPGTCDYYLKAPCKSKCWHNRWEIRDHECDAMGSTSCRWSFEPPWIMGGKCYCCDISC